MTTVQKHFKDFQPWKGIRKLSKLCRFPGMVKNLVRRYEVGISMVLEGSLNEEFLQELWATQCLGDKAEASVVADCLTAETESVLSFLGAATETSPMDYFQKGRRLIRDWEILATLNFLRQECVDLANGRIPEWDSWLRPSTEASERGDFLMDERRAHFFRCRDKARLQDPEERKFAARRKKAYDKSDKGKMKRKGRQSTPEYRAAHAAVMRERRALKRLEAQMAAQRAQEIQERETVHDIQEAAE